MQVALQVEDRDLAYLILDTKGTTACLCELEIEGVDFKDIGDEEKAIWLEIDKKDVTILKVVPREGFDPETLSEFECEIPTPEIVFNQAEYERQI